MIRRVAQERRRFPFRGRPFASAGRHRRTLHARSSVDRATGASSWSRSPSSRAAWPEEDRESVQQLGKMFVLVLCHD